jgi:hypothetical protein
MIETIFQPERIAMAVGVVILLIALRFLPPRKFPSLLAEARYRVESYRKSRLILLLVLLLYCGFAIWRADLDRSTEVVFLFLLVAIFEDRYRFEKRVLSELEKGPER